MTTLPDYIPFKTFAGIPFKTIFKAAGPDLLELLNGLLTHCPSKRFNSVQALKSSWFSNKPAPTPCYLLPQPRSKEEQQKIEAELMEEKRKRRMESLQSSERLSLNVENVDWTWTDRQTDRQTDRDKGMHSRLSDMTKVCSFI